MSSGGQRLPTAMELSMHKTQKERQQAILEQRQLYGLNGTNANVRFYIYIYILYLWINIDKVAVYASGY